MNNKIEKPILKSVIVCLIILVGTIAIRHGISSGIIDKTTLKQMCFMIGGTIGIIIGILLE